MSAFPAFLLWEICVEDATIAFIGSGKSLLMVVV